MSAFVCLPAFLKNITFDVHVDAEKDSEVHNINSQHIQH